MNKFTLAALAVIIGISVLLNVYQQPVSPPCFNADEAAFSYNAFSILKTGRDEYGAFLPLRLKSFGDYKMPLLTYLSIPFIAVMGLNEGSAVMINHLLSALFPIIVFLLIRELTKKDIPSLLGALLVSTSLGLHIVGRHVHEAYLGAFMITLTTWLFLRLLRKTTWKNAASFSISLLLSLFAYQSNRIFALYFGLAAGTYIVAGQMKTRRTRGMILAAVVAVFLLFEVTDIIYKPARVNNLVFFNNAGYGLKIAELRGEGGPRIFYNKLVYGIQTVILEHATYFSPQFLAQNGDANYRFGYPEMPPMTIVEYACALIGFYYIFRRKEPWRFFVSGLVLIAPLSASLSWAHDSLTRPLFLFVPVLSIAGYGLYHLFNDLRPNRLAVAGLIGTVVLGELYFQFFSWDFYLNHYPKRAIVARSWQCGYRGLSDYIKSTYDKTGRYYITKKNGEPYIMMLFYLQYPPAQYQRQAQLSTPDEYGFGQVERFDKFDFNFKIPKDGPAAVIGYPDDFSGTGITEQNVRKVRQGNEDIFWIYEVK